MSRLSGLRAWVVQRLTAVYIAAFVVVAIVAFASGAATRYDDWHALWSCTLVNVAAQLFVLALVLHAWVGVRDIALDYLHPTGLRLAFLGLYALFLAGCTLWAAQVLLRPLGIH